MQSIASAGILTVNTAAGALATVDPKPTIFVVDDDISVRESLQDLIQTAGWEARLFVSAGDFLTSAPAGGPCCLLLDIGLPDANGLDLQTLIAHERVELPIIFITGCGDIPMSVRAMKAGAAEFLTKPLCEDTLLPAIYAALERSRTAGAERAAKQALRARYASLSRREREVMTLVVSGLLNKQVGGELGISEITVKAHRGRMMEKMGAHSLAELVRMSATLDAGHLG